MGELFFPECQNIFKENFAVVKMSNILFMLFKIAKCLNIPREFTGDYIVHQDGWCYTDSDWLYPQSDCWPHVRGRLVSEGQEGPSLFMRWTQEQRAGKAPGGQYFEGYKKNERVALKLTRKYICKYDFKFTAVHTHIRHSSK